MEVVLERFSCSYSPVVYDLTIKNLDSNVLSADLGIKITGNASSLNPGDTVKLTLQAVNNGPNTANIKVNYKIPFGLKLLSSQGQGTYDSSLGVWSAGNLALDGIATVELVLQAVDAGYFVNVVSVYGDLPVTKSISSTSTGVVRFWSAGASSVMYDPNSGNNGANYGVNSLNPANVPDNLNKYPYNFPDNIVPPTPDTPPTPPQKPDDQNTPDLGPLYPKSQIQRDVAGVREAINQGALNQSVLPEWKGTIEEDNINGWEVFSLMVDIAAGLIYAGNLMGTPGSGEYMNQVKNGIINSMNSLKMVAKYFVKNPRYAFDTLKKSFKNWGEGKDTIDYWKNDKNFKLDPNVAQKFLTEWLSKKYPESEGKIRALFGIFGSIQFLSDPLEILKAWGDVVYSIAVDSVGKGDYGTTVKELWEAIDKTFFHPIPFV